MPTEGRDDYQGVDLKNGCIAVIALGVFLFAFAPVVAPVLDGLGRAGIWLAVIMIVGFLTGPFIND